MMKSAHSLNNKPSTSKVDQLLCLVSVAAILLTALFAGPSFTTSKVTLSSLQNGTDIEVRWGVSNATELIVELNN